MIYLRPETNGIKVESTMLKVIHDSPRYKKALEIVYLANLPGDFLRENRVVENHYALRIRFATKGKEAFTETMKRRFQEHFGVPFDKANIIGSFQALQDLDMTEEELAHLWVPHSQVTYIHAQHIKRYKDIYIVNYDIPRLLHLCSEETDIFSMDLRCFIPYSEIHKLIDKISLALKQEEILVNPALHSHVFHYSKGPFEQILDGIGYLYADGDRHIPLSELSFLSFLLSQGCSEEKILEVVREPILSFRGADGAVEEDNLFVRTYEDSFTDALKKFDSLMVL